MEGMKPWEETWSEHELQLCGHDNDAPGDAERRRLASAAPDMARVLLAVEFIECGDCVNPMRDVCPCCQSRTMLPKRPGEIGQPYDVHPGKHAPDCALDAALRKAGAR